MTTARRPAPNITPISARNIAAGQVRRGAAQFVRLPPGDLLLTVNSRNIWVLQGNRTVVG
jgi:hypothetical protein